MREEIRRKREERNKLKEEHPYLFLRILEILYLHDPLGICDDHNLNAKEEYEPEVGTILPRLALAESATATQVIVYEEFTAWFGSTAGPLESYRQIAENIWEVYCQSSDSH